jgi:hypothetical protein
VGVRRSNVLAEDEDEDDEAAASASETYAVRSVTASSAR